MAANSTLSLSLTTGILGLNMSENTTPSESSEHNHQSVAVKVLLGLVLVPIQLTAFSSNLLVISAILTDPVLIQRWSYLLLMSMASADFVLSIMVLPFAIVKEIHGSWVFSLSYCLVWMTLDIMCVTASILSLCLVSIDRYMLIAWHMYYNAHVTRSRVRMMIGVVWLIAFIIAFAPPAFEKIVPEDEHICAIKTSFAYATGSSLVSFYIPCIIILIVYSKLYVIARSHATKIQQCQSHLKHGNDSKPTNVISRGNRTLGILLGVFLFCWLPFFIAHPISAYLEYRFPEVLLEVCVWLGYLNSCANPIIYSRFNQEVRHAFAKKLPFYRTYVAERSVRHTQSKRTSGRPDVLLSASEVDLLSSWITQAHPFPIELAQPGTPLYSQTLETSVQSQQTTITWVPFQQSVPTSPQYQRTVSVCCPPQLNQLTTFHSLQTLYVPLQSQQTMPACVQSKQKSPTSVTFQQTPSSPGGQASPSALPPRDSSLRVRSVSVAQWQTLTISPSPPPPASTTSVSSSVACPLKRSPPPPPPP